MPEAAGCECCCACGFEFDCAALSPGAMVSRCASPCQGGGWSQISDPTALPATSIYASGRVPEGVGCGPNFCGGFRRLPHISAGGCRRWPKILPETRVKSARGHGCWLAVRRCGAWGDGRGAAHLAGARGMECSNTTFPCWFTSCVRSSWAVRWCSMKPQSGAANTLWTDLQTTGPWQRSWGSSVGSILRPSSPRKLLPVPHSYPQAGAG